MFMFGILEFAYNCVFQYMTLERRTTREYKHVCVRRYFNLHDGFKLERSCEVIGETVQIEGCLIPSPGDGTTRNAVFWKIWLRFLVTIHSEES